MIQHYCFFQTGSWLEQLPFPSGQIIQFEDGVYPNGEAFVRIQNPIEKGEVKLFARLSDVEPLDRQFTWLGLLVQSLKRGAGSVTLVIPYVPYSLQEREVYPGDAIAYDWVVKGLEAMGVEKVVLCDPHAQNNLRSWSVPVEVIDASRALADQIQSGGSLENAVVIAPDSGAVARAQELADHLHLPIYVQKKERLGAGEVSVRLEVEDLQNVQSVIFSDDIINSGGTLIASIEALQEIARPANIIVSCTHGLFVKNALSRLQEAGVTRLIVTDSYFSQVHRDQSNQIEVISLANLL